ncbi:MAG: hypothetical protein C5B50_19395 [Verrucomicrobia bacterium]|nr:MAG: hypothetical protein C5B50_19395 [Verrucomicrobiota bacterium]
MNHPNREQWAPYIFGEAKPEARRELKRHLNECAECRQELDLWQRSVRRLDAWELPKPSAPQREWVPALRWAAAAVALVCLGLGIGRASSSKTQMDNVRATIEPQIRAQLVAEFEAKRRQDNQAVYAALDRLYVTLKRDVDTVAVNADAGLRQTERQLVELASYEQPSPNR